MPNSINTFKSLEVFAGAGGAALGFERAGFENVALCEIDKHACATLRKNRPNWNVIEKDIRDVNWSEYKGIPDVVVGGFPCQAFSYAGKKHGFGDPRGTLFFEFARCVDVVRPLIAIAENVGGLVTHDKGRTIATILNHMESIGYRCVSKEILNAQDYDVPQKRSRFIGVWVRADSVEELPEFNLPESSGVGLTLRDALKTGRLYDCDVPISVGSTYSVRKHGVLSLVPPGGNWRNLPEDIAKDFMKATWYSGGGRTGVARRLSWDAPSPTLLTIPIQMQTERCHPDHTRPLTVREYARIQTFSDNWEFCGSVSSQYRQIGNAVPVNFAFHIAGSAKAFIQSFRDSKSSQARAA